MKATTKEKTAQSIGVDKQSSVPQNTNINRNDIVTNGLVKGKKFITKDGKTLLTTPLQRINFIVDSLISQGLHILAGEPKIGKSWLALDLCMKITTGKNLWKFPVNKGTTLYLCLEDSDLRIQNRMLDLVDFCDEFNEDDYKDIHFSTAANVIGGGLEQQIESFVAEHTDTRLIVIDTLQRVRNISNDNAYGNDYNELGVLKSIADKLGIAIVLIHHLCKQAYGNNPLSRVSGTSAITGAADSIFVLEKEKADGDKAKLFCVGRDIEQRELQLQFDKDRHAWNFIADSIDEPEKFLEDVLKLLSDFIKEQKYFDGTPNALVELIQSHSKKEIKPNSLSRKLLQNKYELEGIGIFSSHRRSSGKRLITLEYRDVAIQNSDDSDGISIPLKTDPIVPTDPHAIKNKPQKKK